MSEVKLFYGRLGYPFKRDVGRENANEQINKYAKENNLKIQSIDYKEEGMDIVATVIFHEEQNNILTQNLEVKEKRITDLEKQIEELQEQLADIKELEEDSDLLYRRSVVQISELEEKNKELKEENKLAKEIINKLLADYNDRVVSFEGIEREDKTAEIKAKAESFLNKETKK